MKAQLYTQTVYESVTDWNHRGSFLQPRLYIPDENLEIVVHAGVMRAWHPENIDNLGDFVRELNIPESMVQAALDLRKSQDQANLHNYAFKTLCTGKGDPP